MNVHQSLIALMLTHCLIASSFPTTSPNIDFNITEAKVFLEPTDKSEVTESALQILLEEVQKRVNKALIVSSELNFNENQVILCTKSSIIQKNDRNLPPFDEIFSILNSQLKPEGYAILSTTTDNNAHNLWIIGYDHRGILYGVGRLLRIAQYRPESVTCSLPIRIVSSPVSKIRGHQLGYRAKANSYDAWDIEQFEQYIRELTFFGINSIENIPFQDEQHSPLMKVPRRIMNKAMSEICKKYGLEYWVWTPAEFDLDNGEKRTQMLNLHEELYRDCPELTGVFFPGGDPGDNPPEKVLPFLEELAKRLIPIHPKAKIWLSLQGFNPTQVKFVMDYIARENPSWLGGLCEGPSSPPIALLRQQLPANYPIRMYPDITHNKLCQYPVPWWDIAFALTLGREAINPRPVQYAYIHNWFQPYCDGFISYSDGIHDDVNKVIWSALSWDPAQPVRQILVEYANVFFGTDIAERVVEGILALERNWRGPIEHNASIEGTLLLWQELEQKAPQLANNWRWQLCLTRAYYDAHVRRKYIADQELERTANHILAQAEEIGAIPAMEKALSILNQPVDTGLRDKIFDLFDRLFHSIGLQSSVDRYHASGGERGASLDYIDIPLNNRWWLEDQFAEIRNVESESERVKRLREIAYWENPPYGSFYDDVGNTGKSPHVKRCEAPVTNPAEEAWLEPTLWWFDNGKSRKRLSWQSSIENGSALYPGLDPNGTYILRISGYGKPMIQIDGEHVQSITKPVMANLGETQEFHVPTHCLQDREIHIQWSIPPEDLTKNWRQYSRICEMWLLKQ